MRKRSLSPPLCQLRGVNSEWLRTPDTMRKADDSQTDSVILQWHETSLKLVVMNMLVSYDTDSLPVYPTSYWRYGQKFSTCRMILNHCRNSHLHEIDWYLRLEAQEWNIWKAICKTGDDSMFLKARIHKSKKHPTVPFKWTNIVDLDEQNWSNIW